MEPAWQGTTEEEKERTMSKMLKVIRTEVENNYTTTAIASTISEAVISVDGTEETIQAGEGNTLVLVVDGVQKDLLTGKEYEVNDSYCVKTVKVYHIGGPKAAPWIGAKEEEKATYYFRQALFVDQGKIVKDGSVEEVINGGSYDNKKAEGITLDAGGAHFNGILLFRIITPLTVSPSIAQRRLVSGCRPSPAIKSQ